MEPSILAVEYNRLGADPCRSSRINTDMSSRTAPPQKVSTRALRPRHAGSGLGGHHAATTRVKTSTSIVVRLGVIRGRLEASVAGGSC